MDVLSKELISLISSSCNEEHWSQFEVKKKKPFASFALQKKKHNLDFG